jgi:hypothetical protein
MTVGEAKECSGVEYYRPKRDRFLGRDDSVCRTFPKLYLARKLNLRVLDGIGKIAVCQSIKLNNN